MTGLNTILAIAANRLPAVGIDCILIGGFAVNHYGYTRNTLDVDFMIFSDQLDLLKQIMQEEGFTNVSIQENVAFFNKPDSPLRVDFLRADTATMQKLLRNAVTINMHGYTIKVPSLKDLIAMKIFAFANAPARRLGKDLPDITFLITLHELDMEADIRPLCNQFGTRQTYDLINEQVKALRS